MPLSLAYWILMFIWLLSGIWWGTSAAPETRLHIGTWSLVLFLLFLVIGLRVFGAPIKSG